MSGTAGFGVKMNNGTKIMEAKSNGNFIISGNTYYTSATTAGYTANGTFDSFDLAEIYDMDAEYPAGTVVCPKDGTLTLTQCSHVGCNLAGVIVTQPGYAMGVPNVPSDPTYYDNTQPIAQYVSLTGRIIANCEADVPALVPISSPMALESFVLPLVRIQGLVLLVCHLMWTLTGLFR